MRLRRSPIVCMAVTGECSSTTQSACQCIPRPLPVCALLPAARCRWCMCSPMSTHHQTASSGGPSVSRGVCKRLFRQASKQACGASLALCKPGPSPSAAMHHAPWQPCCCCRCPCRDAVERPCLLAVAEPHLQSCHCWPATEFDRHLLASLPRPHPPHTHDIGHTLACPLNLPCLCCCNLPQSSTAASCRLRCRWMWRRSRAASSWRSARKAHHW